MNAAKALVETYYALVDAQDDAMFHLFHDDVVYKRPGYPTLAGRRALQKFYQRDRVIPSGRHTVHELFVGDQGRVAVEGRFCGVLKNGTEADLAFSDFFDLDLTQVPPQIIARRTYLDDARV